MSLSPMTAKRSLALMVTVSALLRDLFSAYAMASMPCSIRLAA